MYPVLEKEIVNKAIKKKDIAKELGIKQSTLSCKLSGKNEFTLKECKKIRELLHTDIGINKLFLED